MMFFLEVFDCSRNEFLIKTTHASMVKVRFGTKDLTVLELVEEYEQNVRNLSKNEQ